MKLEDTPIKLEKLSEQLQRLPRHLWDRHLWELCDRLTTEASATSRVYATRERRVRDSGRRTSRTREAGNLSRRAHPPPESRKPHKRSSVGEANVRIALLVADDHPLVREGLRRTFEAAEVAVVAEAGCIDDAIRFAFDPAVTVMLLDLSWPQRRTREEAGFEILRRVKSRRSDLPILIYSAQDLRQFVDRARSLGATGYLVKGVDDKRLALAVRRAHAGSETWPG
jgi:CheY-like chemotaxis protein